MSSARKVKTKQQQTDKVRERIDGYFSEGLYYDAQQLYKTLIRIYSDAEDYETAANVAYEGAQKLLEFKQGNAGGELAAMVVECWVKSKSKPESDKIQIVLKLFQAFTNDARDSRASFMKTAISWTSQFGNNPHGEPLLHLDMARSYRIAVEYSTAHKHYLRARQPEEHAQMLIEWSRKGFKNERDLFIVRTVLQYLCLESIKNANLVVGIFRKEYTDGSLDTPLMNFSDFLLKTVERKAGPLFEMLRLKYAPSLSRDATLGAYLDQIGDIYFGIKASKGMLDNLLGGFGKMF